MKAPLVSVIVATYNASHLLKYAIRSVIASTYTNWELIVVGDCCTDNTKELVHSFEDNRISFYNLKKNSGQQATPNNYGLTKAKGKFIAFLNQDDMYFSFHLENCVDLLSGSKKEIICVPYFMVSPTTKKNLENHQFHTEIWGSPPFKKFTPHVFHVASSWFFHRSCLQKVGNWKLERNLLVTPSKEWIYRAYNKGIKFLFPDSASVVTIFTGMRKGTYKKKTSHEHEYFYNNMTTNPNFINTLYKSAAIYSSSQQIHSRYYQATKNFFRAIISPIYRILDFAGIHPIAFRNLFLYGSKGGFIRKYHKKIGIEKVQK